MIMVLGGYGGFGARIARRLAEAGETVGVVGRDAGKAQAFCAGHPRLLPLALDRDVGLAEALARHRPFAVVDAAGPFQDLDTAVAAACIAARCHYVDIADGRAFVASIPALDAAAKAAGVCVIAGASSVPALSGAVIRALADGMETVRAVEIAISASNKATAGLSVTRAILSYVGRPLRIWRAGRWATTYGWQEIRRQGFALEGAPTIPPRFVALADVPDLDLVPARLAGRPAVGFRAGTELAVENLALWILSWPVRWRWLAGLDALAPSIIGLKRFMRIFGTDRSAMSVQVFGTAGGRRLERRWTLMAFDGDGPEIPALAVPIFIDRMRRGALEPGARDGGQDLGLPDFAASFAGLSLRHATVAIDQPAPLYARVMGPRFAALPPRVRLLHDVLSDGGAVGEATVARGVTPAARLVAWFLRFPAAGRHDLHVAFSERNGIETWTRDFGGKRFSSVLSQRDDHVVERFGPLRFAFALDSVERRDPDRRAGLSMRFVRWWIGVLPMPAWAVPRIEASEWEADDRFHFDVAIGRVIRYRGWLVPAAASGASRA